MIIPARKAVAFLEKHDSRLRDVLGHVDLEDLAGLLREARLLVYGANADEQVDLWLFIAVGEARRGDFAAALDMLEKVRAVHPNMGLIANDLGATLTHLGRYDEALKRFIEAEELSKDDPVTLAIATFNEVLSRVNLNDMTGAVAAFRRGLRIAAPEVPTVLVLKACAAARLGWEEDAVEYLARSYCTRAGQPRGDAPALDVIDRLAPAVEAESATPEPFTDAVERVLSRAVRVVRERERTEPPPEMVPRARVQLPPDAWTKFQQLLAE